MRESICQDDHSKSIYGYCFDQFFGQFEELPSLKLASMVDSNRKRHMTQSLSEGWQQSSRFARENLGSSGRLRHDPLAYNLTSDADARLRRLLTLRTPMDGLRIPPQ